MRILTLVLLSAATLAASSDQTLGKGIDLAEVTSIKALYETPDKYVGKTIRVDGIVTAVCEEMGCWMALGADAKAEHVVRFKVGHDAGITFPVTARGKTASAQGVFEKIAAGDTEANNAAAEHKAEGAAADFGKKYQIKATGAIVK
jgi:hypothetical protein